MKLFSILLVVLLCLTLVSADRFIDDEAEQILSADSLTIKQEISTKTQISGKLNWFEVNHNFYPKDTYRQTIVSSEYTPSYDSKNESNIVYKIKNPSSSPTTTSEYIVTTQSLYKEIGGDVSFPVKGLPEDVLQYTKETEYMDITPEIKATASLIASGKSDLFQVSQDIATWVVTNIEYDLSTLTADAVQKASWVMKNRAGVCDELSIVYIAMMRSLGVPARYVSGISYTNSDLFEQPWNPHAWTEVYFPGYGWVPFDLTYQQFGFVDASHITFSTSADAGKILTSYLWEGYDLDNLNVDLSETRFNQEILSYGDTIDEGFIMDVKSLYNTVGLRSYNILEITLENTKNHYVSSTLKISAPFEVSMDKTKLPIYIKPKETKKYYLLQSLPGLSTGYVYTMPITVYTSFGSSASTEFKAAEKYSHISLDQVNAYLSQNTKDTSASSFAIQCSPEKDLAAVDENIDVICSVVNNGNVYLVDGQLCFDNSCDSLTVEIGGSSITEFTVSQSNPGQYSYGAEISFGEVTEKTSFSISVLDTAAVKISSINFSSIIPGKEFTGSVLLTKESQSVPNNIDLRITINGDLYSWNLDKLTQSTNIQIPLHSYLLEDGQNTIDVFVSWEDMNGGTHFVEDSEAITIDFSTTDKIKAWWHKLFV